MTWICQCGLVNVNANTYCAACIFTNPRFSKRTEIGDFDSYDELLTSVRLHSLRRLIDMTPQEELFAKLFNHEIEFVKDMSILEIRAHREELARITYEGSVRIRAVDHVEKERIKAKKISEGPTGIERNKNVDEQTSQAINVVKERQKRLTKLDKIKENLLKIDGMDASFVEGLMKNKNILEATKQRAQNTSEPIMPEETVKQIEEANKQMEKKEFVNPFSKKRDDNGNS